MVLILKTALVVGVFYVGYLVQGGELPFWLFFALAVFSILFLEDRIKRLEWELKRSRQQMSGLSRRLDSIHKDFMEILGRDL
ncbi:hypothetical protein [Thalassospira marina]|uniref:Uncharacterized protein n=1 Tax=Thalassospira marina TaxID=2048283 RepID=A0A2N3KXY1_9PROT|nr:hypothetical protein [Thalassospira marina]PKR55398.1 hypothetical protein COO20_04305 [Thalassospira marina]